MKVAVNSQVFSKLEGFKVGLIHCSRIDNKGDSGDIHEMLRDVEELIRLNFDSDTLKSDKMISATRAAVEHYGNVEHYESNVETLMSQVLQGKDIKSESKLVDLCNFVSFKYLLPIGTTDMKKVRGDLQYKLAVSEKIKNDKIQKGELILKDSLKVISIGFDFMTDHAATKNSKKVLVHVEALEPVSVSKLRRIVDELAGLIKIFCGGKVQKAVLHKDVKNVDFV
jgi:DNA/RNA-binding domain of Phe-tRNA-synthetase-like protein